MASYLQRLPLLVQQVGDVLRNPLHQVSGVVPPDLELALLLIVDLQRRNTPMVKRQVSQTNCEQKPQLRDAIDHEILHEVGGIFWRTRELPLRPINPIGWTASISRPL